MDNRQIRAMAIISKGDAPTVISREEFVMPSQSGNGKYKVFHREEWSCECKDFQARKEPCKHILATQFWLRMREKSRAEGSFGLENEVMGNCCPFCNSESIVRNGSRKTKEGEVRQRFLCRGCKKRFVLDPLKGFKGNGKIITLALDLYFKGLSLRKITDTINQFHSLKLHHETIRRWIVRFTKIMNDHVSQFTPKTGETWHADEQFAKARNGENKWNVGYIWNIMDSNTRFLIASKMTKYRSRDDTRDAFKEAKKNANIQPKQVITDKWHAYRGVVKQELPDAKHIQYKGFMAGTQNNRIERFHGTFRERDKVMRGLKSVKTANAHVQAYRTYYNFLRPHQAFNGLTPAQMAGIDLNLEGNRWLSLLKQSKGIN